MFVKSVHILIPLVILTMIGYTKNMMITDPVQIELLRHTTLMCGMAIELNTGMKMSRGTSPFAIAAHDGYCSPRSRWTRAAKREALVEMHSMRLANDPDYQVSASVAKALGL